MNFERIKGDEDEEEDNTSQGAGRQSSRGRGFTPPRQRSDSAAGRPFIPLPRRPEPFMPIQAVHSERISLEFGSDKKDKKNDREGEKEEKDKEAHSAATPAKSEEKPDYSSQEATEDNSVSELQPSGESRGAEESKESAEPSLSPTEATTEAQDDSWQESHVVSELADQGQESAAPEALTEQPIEPSKESDSPYEGVLHIQRPPQPAGSEQAQTEAPRHESFGQSWSANQGSAHEQEEPPRQTQSSGNFPPPPPFGPAEAAPGQPEDPDPEPKWNHSPSAQHASWNSAPAAETWPSSPPAETGQSIKEFEKATDKAEKKGLRRGLVAGFLTGYVLKAYLERRKRDRYERLMEGQAEKRQQEIAQLQADRQRLMDKMVADSQRPRFGEAAPARPVVHAERPAQQPRVTIEAANNLPPIKNAEKPKDISAEVEAALESQKEEMFDHEGNKIVLKPGWRVERSAGGYSMVLDERGRVVHDAIRYGDEFKRDKRHESLADDILASIGLSGQPGSSGSSDGQAKPVFLPPTQPTPKPKPAKLNSVLANHQPINLPDGGDQSLSRRRKSRKSAIFNPWLWTAVALLIIVYFLAALI